MTLKKTFLDTSETLARIREALPQGHRLLGLARDFASGAEDPSAPALSAPALSATALGFEGRPAQVPDGFRAGLQAAASAAAWPGEFGALFSPEGKEGQGDVVALFFLGGPPEPQGSRPWAAPQLVIDLPPARYRIEYWKAGDGLLMGVEIGTGPRLVISPPDEIPLVVSIGVLP